LQRAGPNSNAKGNTLPAASRFFFSLILARLSSPLSAASNYLAHNNESKRLLCCCCSLSVRIRNPLHAASNFSAAYLGIISMGLIKSHRRASTVKLFFLSPVSKYQKMRASSQWTPQRDIFFGSWVYWVTKLVHLNSGRTSVIFGFSLDAALGLYFLGVICLTIKGG
jgi:hypothetical protein